MKTKFDISKLNPSLDIKEYCEAQPDFETAWNECKRGDWMLWIAYALGVNDRILTLAKGHCANIVRHFITHEMSIAAIDAAIKYGNGEIEIEEMNNSDISHNFATYTADSYATYYSARKENQQQTADICRKYLTEEVFKITQNEDNNKIIYNQAIDDVYNLLENHEEDIWIGIFDDILKLKKV